MNKLLMTITIILSTLLTQSVAVASGIFTPPVGYALTSNECQAHIQKYESSEGAIADLEDFMKTRYPFYIREVKGEDKGEAYYYRYFSPKVSTYLEFVVMKDLSMGYCLKVYKQGGVKGS